MLDVFMRRERHIYVEDEGGDKKKKGPPSLRDFGPQSEDDLIDQRSLELLVKLLPVLNGLIYLKKGKIVCITLTQCREPRGDPERL